MSTKLFAVYARLSLEEKLVWLDAFRAKYDKPYEDHITLKQPCVIRNSDMPDIRQKVASVITAFTTPDHRIRVSFDRVRVNLEMHDGVCVMIEARRSPLLAKLQKNMVNVLNEYRVYYRPEAAAWEARFVPHITVGREIDPAVWKRAHKEIKSDTRCVGTISEIVLVAVDRMTPEEALKHENLTVYRL